LTTQCVTLSLALNNVYVKRHPDVCSGMYSVPKVAREK